MKGIAQYAEAPALDVEQMVSDHAHLIKRIAYHLINRLPPSVQIDDLMQAGVVGLLEAARNYDPAQGASFETYAGIRIRGAMLDELRRTDWTPRSVHRNTRRVSEAIRAVENRAGRPARDHEVAAELEMDMDTYHQLLRDTAASKVASVEDVFVAGEEQIAGDGEPYQELHQDLFKQALVDIIDGLPERERLVMSLYYEEDLNLREIGEILGVSESRVCQIHGQALARIRTRMQDWTSGQGTR